MVCQSLLPWTMFYQNSSPQPVRLGWPYTAWLSFIELDKAVVNITLPTKVRLVKAMVFPVVMYGCESWTVKKAER